MARTEWHEETWEEVKLVLVTHFEKLGFEVDVNNTVRTVTIIHERKALSVMDTTFTHFDGQDRLVFPELFEVRR